MVELTDIAAEKVRDFMNGQGAVGDVGLRVGVRGGGCSGFQYALALDEKRDDDHVFEAGGINVLVDPASLQYVDGSTVDYTETFQGSGFEVSEPQRRCLVRLRLLVPRGGRGALLRRHRLGAQLAEGPVEEHQAGQRGGREQHQVHDARGVGGVDGALRGRIRG